MLVATVVLFQGLKQIEFSQNDCQISLQLV